MIHELLQPTLEDLRGVFQDYFAKCFSVVSCHIVECPNLASNTFGMKFEGLRGSETLCDIGSFDYLLPTPNKDKVHLKIDPQFAPKIRFRDMTYLMRFVW
ncbi:hypothetical protein P879_12017, partial [Paragonimus westermani]